LSDQILRGGKEGKLEGAFMAAKIMLQNFSKDNY